MIRELVELSGMTPASYLRGRTGETMFDPRGPPLSASPMRTPRGVAGPAPAGALSLRVVTHGARSDMRLPR